MYTTEIVKLHITSVVRNKIIWNTLRDHIAYTSVYSYYSVNPCYSDYICMYIYIYWTFLSFDTTCFYLYFLNY